MLVRWLPEGCNIYREHCREWLWDRFDGLDYEIAAKYGVELTYSEPPYTKVSWLETMKDGDSGEALKKSDRARAEQVLFEFLMNKDVAV